MAQVNQSPGVNETNRNIAVAPGTLQFHAPITRAGAALTTVAYNQTEPGTNKPKRS